LNLLKQIEQLILLQKVDSEIFSLNKKLDEAPQEVSTIQEKLETQKNQQAQVEEKISILKQQEQKLNKEIEEDNDRIKQSKNKLMMVENSKEYHAMMREMDNLEKTNRLREEEKLAVEEDLAAQNNIKSSLDTEIDKLENELKEKQERLDEQLDGAQSRLDELRKKRENATQEIPQPILSRYEFIRSRLSHPVIVPVDNGVCTGCHISIPPQSFIELQKGEQILSCPNCQRLLFWDNHFSDNGDHP